MHRGLTSTMKYDKAADALAISFHPRPAGTPTTRVIAVTAEESIHADFIGAQLVGLEILDASRLIPRKALATISAAGELLSVKKAAALTKRQPRTLQIACERGRIAGAVKDGRDWLIPASSLWTYIDELSPRGRPPKARSAPNRKRILAARGRDGAGENLDVRAAVVGEDADTRTIRVSAARPRAARHK